MRMIFCTCPVNESEKIIKVVLERQLVACVNVIPMVQSHYFWKGELCHDEESLLVMKSKKELIPQLTDAINEVHSYDTVEIITFEIKEGDSKYLKWIDDVTKKL